MEKETIDTLFPEYLKKLKEGYYDIPPLLQIEEIIKNRYKPELLEVSRTCYKDFLVCDVKDFYNIEIFKDIYNNIDDFDLNDTKLLYLYTAIFLKETTFTIKYPEVIIKNGKPDGFHTIRDLYMRYSFNLNGQLIINKPLMGRSTYTMSEMLAKYKHSHHPTVSIDERSYSAFNETCLGSGVLSSTTSLLRNWKCNEFDIIRVMAFIADIDAYIAWESLEGGPHIRMSTIKNSFVVGYIKAIKFQGYGYIFLNKLYSNITHFACKKLAKTILASDYIIKNSKLIPSIKNKKAYYSIEYNEYEMILYFTKVAKDLGLWEDFKRFGFTYFITKDVFNKVSYYRTSSDSKVQEINICKRLAEKNITLFTFKDKPVKLKVIDDITIKDPKLVQEEVITPAIMHDIIKELEKSINKKNGRNKFQETNL